jgi:formylglycine-generating enzyme required for sulfatase activity
LNGARAIQRGVGAADYGPGCPPSGEHCTNLYAVSIPGVPPSRFMSWFQAAAMARNSDKRLPTNAEWQAAALGTPTDPRACSIRHYESATILSGDGTTGSSLSCFSDIGAYDMVGNLWEWVADWQWRDGSPPPTGYQSASYTGRVHVVAVAKFYGVLRGGSQDTSSAEFLHQPTLLTLGPLAVGNGFVGFRAAR